MALILLVAGAVGGVYAHKNKDEILALKNKVESAVESAIAAFKDKLK